MMKHAPLFFVLLILFSITASIASAATPNAADCTFDPKNIVINDVVKLYSCVPMADALCARTCGEKSLSTAINTTIENTKIGKTTILCRIPNGDAAQKREAGVNGMADTIAIQCEPSAAPIATSPTK